MCHVRLGICSNLQAQTKSKYSYIFIVLTRRFFYFLVFIYWRFLKVPPGVGLQMSPGDLWRFWEVLKLQESFMIAPGSSPGNSGQEWRRWEPRAISGASEVVMEAARGLRGPWGTLESSDTRSGFSGGDRGLWRKRHPGTRRNLQGLQGCTDGLPEPLWGTQTLLGGIFGKNWKRKKPPNLLASGSCRAKNSSIKC